MKLFGSGSTEKLCLSAPSGAMNAHHAEPETKQLHPSSLVNISSSNSSRSRVVLSILLIHELSLPCPSLFCTSEQKAYG